MAAYEIAVGPTPEYQTAWRSWAVGVYEFVAGGDTACETYTAGLGAEPLSRTITAVHAIYMSGHAWLAAYRSPLGSFANQRVISAGGWITCESPPCDICGGPNTAAFEGGGWCDGCDQDARLDGDGGEG
jgi:hypothetical protein